jgi:phosphoribosylformylglycinamidine cyclo-ligase
MWEVFNMGCGFCAIVPPEHAPEALEILARHHPGATLIGRLTDRVGTVAVPSLGLEGDASGLRALGG